MIIPIIVAAILVIMGVIILLGKGDNLIAGYNTASMDADAAAVIHLCQADDIWFPSMSVRSGRPVVLYNHFD